MRQTETETETKKNWERTRNKENVKRTGKNTGLVVHTFKPLRNKGKKEKRSASHDKSPED